MGADADADGETVIQRPDYRGGRKDWRAFVKENGHNLGT